MENLGLIIYREKLMLYRPGSSSAEDKKEVGRVVAHELAHQVEMPPFQTEGKARNGPDVSFCSIVVWKYSDMSVVV